MKNPVVAFFLSIVPGLGHLYIGRYIRTFFYLGGSILLLFLSIIAIWGLNGGEGAAALGAVVLFFVWCISMLDMILTISNKNNGVFLPKPVYQNINGQLILVEPVDVKDPLVQAQHDELMKIIFMSIVPGLAHLYMLFTRRGLSIMVSFLALLVLPFVINSWMHMSGIVALVLFSPILWIYSMFDARRIIKAKQNDIVVADTYIFDMLLSNLVADKKSDTALIFSLIPGFGHFILGYAKQGLQLVLITVATMVLINDFHMPYFRYFTILIWAYSFFDTLYILRNQQSKQQPNETLLAAFQGYKRWIGLGLLVIGVYYIFNLFAVNFLDNINETWYRYYIKHRYTVLSGLAAFTIIFVGIKLMTSSIAEHQKRKQLKK